MEPEEPEERLQQRTLRKLDCILLPCLAALFLFNALDKANIGNAESAHFSHDVGLKQSDVNTAVALFFVFFVALQPLGAVLGRRHGMRAFVPTCMFLWGLSTALHAWVRHRWQLFALRILIGCLEAGFYPVTVTYLSLFYTRFEFGRRLSLFYGQAAVGAALGGLISWAVFSRFRDHGQPTTTTRRPWQVLFLLEGTLTMLFAVSAYFLLPHNVESAWFLSPQERHYASSRVLQDRHVQNVRPAFSYHPNDCEQEDDQESRGLLSHPVNAPSGARHHASLDDRGVSAADVFSAVFSIKIWHLLACNILSAIPVYAFSVFLPLVLAPLTKNSNPALVNLLTAPPHVCGAVVLYFFARYSDLHRIRLLPILCGLAIVVVGLTLVVILPTSWAIARYLALNILLSGTYIASPLTVAWISGNTPSPGKRAILLGINGWGNIAGVIAAILYQPVYADSGYIVPFWWTLCSVAVSAVGYMVFLKSLQWENTTRKIIMSSWNQDAIELEKNQGRGPRALDHGWATSLADAARSAKLSSLADRLEYIAQDGRQGDERLTFVYGL
ncbi:hypothetical protein ACEQ8H_008492 [Pleosporales sp. CAS-2024a]